MFSKAIENSLQRLLHLSQRGVLYENTLINGIMQFLDGTVAQRLSGGDDEVHEFGELIANGSFAIELFGLQIIPPILLYFIELLLAVGNERIQHGKVASGEGLLQEVVVLHSDKLFVFGSFLGDGLNGALDLLAEQGQQAQASFLHIFRQRELCISRGNGLGLIDFFVDLPKKVLAGTCSCQPLEHSLFNQFGGGLGLHDVVGNRGNHSN